MKLPTDRYEASRGLFATAELLVRFNELSLVGLALDLLDLTIVFQCNMTLLFGLSGNYTGYQYAREFCSKWLS